MVGFSGGEDGHQLLWQLKLVARGHDTEPNSDDSVNDVRTILRSALTDAIEPHLVGREPGNGGAARPSSASAGPPASPAHRHSQERGVRGGASAAGHLPDRSPPATGGTAGGEGAGRGSLDRIEHGLHHPLRHPGRAEELHPRVRPPLRARRRPPYPRARHPAHLRLAPGRAGRPPADRDADPSSLRDRTDDGGLHPRAFRRHPPGAPQARKGAARPRRPTARRSTTPPPMPRPRSRRLPPSTGRRSN